MEEIKITSGTGFEGYEIEEYGPYKFTQIILSSNFVKEIGSSIADIATDRSGVYQAKLDGAMNDAIVAFKEMVGETSYNGVIGFNINVVDYSSNVSAVVASGTLVKVNKEYVSEFQKANFVRNELFVMNYYNKAVPRAVKVILASEGDGTKIAAWFNNYSREDIRAIKADIEFVNIYGDITTLTGVDFVFDNQINLSLLKSDYSDCKLPDRYIKLISSSKVYIKKYVTSRGVYACGDEPIDINLSPVKFNALKNKRGLDAVANYKSDGLVWTCNCGHVNESGAEECVICGRKQEDLKSTVTFDYEPMLAEMQTKEYVVELKDVLKKYLPSLDASIRIQLLEIMESGSQYERKRGSAKDTVIEKIENLFLGL